MSAYQYQIEAREEVARFAMLLEHRLKHYDQKKIDPKWKDKTIQALLVALKENSAGLEMEITRAVEYCLTSGKAPPKSGLDLIKANALDVGARAMMIVEQCVLLARLPGQP